MVRRCMKRMAEDALDNGKKVCAANREAAAFHDGMEELVDVEEISEEDNKPKRLLGFKEREVASIGMVSAVRGKNQFHYIRCGRRVPGVDNGQECV